MVALDYQLDGIWDHHGNKSMAVSVVDSLGEVIDVGHSALNVDDDTAPCTSILDRIKRRQQTEPQRFAHLLLHASGLWK